MRPFYNTPGVINPPSQEPPTLTGQALIDKIENEYAYDCDDCNNGDCKSDPAVHAEFRDRLRRAKQ